jgi:hypothetical protein
VIQSKSLAVLRHWGWYHVFTTSPMASFAIQLRHESKTLLYRVGLIRGQGPRALLLNLAILLVFGFVFPWQKGLGFPDPVIITAYCCLGVLFAAPAAAQACAEYPPQSFAAAGARIFWCVIYGEIMALAMLAGGIATFNVAHWLGQFMYPSLPTVAPALALGLTGSTAFASAAAAIALRFSVGAARVALRMMFLGLLVLFFFYSRWLPDVAGTAALICLAVSVAILLALRASMRAAQ